jgi:hypothetical protein
VLVLLPHTVGIGVSQDADSSHKNKSSGKYARLAAHPLQSVVIMVPVQKNII